MSYQTPGGVVTITDMVYREDPSGVACIEVNTADGQGAPPHFRIFNPPILAPDPAGDIEIGGRRYREDPVRAVALSIGLHRSNRKAPR